MVALADVRRWNAAAVEDAFRGFGSARDHLLDLDNALHGAQPPAEWTGQASAAARAEYERLTERLRRVAAGATACRPALADAADAVAGIQRDLTYADSLAASGGFVIGADGSVTDTRQLLLPPDQVAAYQARRMSEMVAIRSLVDNVLRRADEVDAGLAAVVAGAVADQIDDGTATTLAGAASNALHTAAPAPPADASPSGSNAWWSTLSAAQREAVLVAHPEWVGNRDGIPAAVRDEANRALLPDRIAAIDTRLAAATARWEASLDTPLSAGNEGQGETRDQLQAWREVQKIQQLRDAAAAVEHSIAAPGRQLLLLDLEGHLMPRAAVAVGDVDTAQHVAVFTPGLTTTVANDLVDYSRDVENVATTATAQLDRVHLDGQRVATVAWLGYDAPQLDQSLFDPSRSVAFDTVAQQGGADLARFYDGIKASRPNDIPHLTALGHSYGSTTTGYALQQSSQVDDAVLFGSPGPGTTDIKNLHVPAGHVGVLEAIDDPVADLGEFGGGTDHQDTNHLEGVVNLSSDKATAPDGTPLTYSEGHSEYLVPGTTSQYNIATTVAGLNDQRIAGDNSGVGDLVPLLGHRP